MKQLENCKVENCIPTPSSCVIWNGGDIEYLGICQGDSLNNVVVEIIDKLKSIAGEDLSAFDIDTLLTICKQKEPLEVNLISILTLLRDNQVCLKDYIDILNDKILELGSPDAISVNLKCYAQLDNIGNQLSITRAQLDQLVIDELCSHKSKIQVLEGKYTTLKTQVDNINPTANVVEPNISTCIDTGLKSTSAQVKSVATEVCNMRTAIGTPAKVAQALSKTPTDWNSKFGNLQGWDMTTDNWAESYGNLLLAFQNVLARLESIETNCCAMTCEDVKLGFFSSLNEDGDAILITFSHNSGTSIPAGFIDKGSTGTITDKNGLIISFNLTITNNSEIEIPLSGLDISDVLEININSRIGNDALTCDKCINRRITVTGNKCCVFSNNTNADVTLLYEIPVTTT